MFENKNWRVVSLITICFGIYFILSVLSFAFGFSWEPFEKVNLITDVFKKNDRESTEAGKLAKSDPKKQNLATDFELYKKPDLITRFYKDQNVNVLPHFSEKLHQIKSTGKGKLRVAYFGDSMIEGDLLTQTLRQLLQKEFGGYGVGFLPIQTNVGSFRKTASIKGSGWKTTNFMDKGAKNMYISGFSFSGMGNSVLTDKSVSSTQTLQKYLLYGNAGGGSINFNGSNVRLNGNSLVNSQLLSSDTLATVNFKSNSASMPVYGMSFESENGIILDNFSFRGITGIEFKKIDEDFLKAVQNSSQYDLIVMQYGVNLLWKPDTEDFSFYTKNMKPVLEKFNKAFPKTDILLVSSADRAFMYNGTYETATGLPNVLETQAQLAFDYNLAFFNLFETMGGKNSIVGWALQNPPLANKDYIHPNAKGTDVLAQKIYQALIKDYKKYKPTTPTAK
ncbi:hypothetical protein [Chryseobacterium sp. Leaf394]|uniref:hypothetical protein n=1 Tax=Chryseobacterium sp. Leaf394 TaxID=1736361 RepID=UPI0006F3E3EA|nr:hypothetical protein [Chryseobacterium sp. Leaf394]KQS92672.1 hypothetical protein ASG21_09610 [Chryseobacterium sp. Leaf394]